MIVTTFPLYREDLVAKSSAAELICKAGGGLSALALILLSRKLRRERQVLRIRKNRYKTETQTGFNF